MRFVFLIVLWTSSAFANPVDKGNEAFWAGKFPAAASAYHQAISQNASNADLWYNLGTAEAKAERMGHAVHAFEQALALRPGDEDARFNLEKIRGAILEKGLVQAGSTKVVPPGEDDVGTSLLTAMSVTTLSITFALTWALLFGLLLIWRRATRPAVRTASSFTALVMGLLAVASGAILVGRVYMLNGVDYGVVLTRSQVRAGPGADYTRGLTLLDGVKVRLRGTDDGWQQITLPDGSEGWLPKAQVKALIQP